MTKNRSTQLEQRVGKLINQVEQLTKLVRDTDGQRQNQYGTLTTHLQTLLATTSKLQSTLANERQRGSWGEQIAGGILQTAGFLEGKHYLRQKTISNGNGGDIRPDFTFFLPNRLTVHMDVKFPLNNYERYFNDKPANEAERQKYLHNFVNDSKAIIDQTCKYINTNTLDCALMFIPNEALFHFLTETETVRDYALKKKVIICSPMSLLMILAIITQACETFALEKSLGKIRATVKSLAEDISEYADELGTLEDDFIKIQGNIEQLKTKRARKLKTEAGKLQELIDHTRLLESENTVT
jgi:DNA recombination protein RmuC